MRNDKIKMLLINGHIKINYNYQKNKRKIFLILFLNQIQYKKY